MIYPTVYPLIVARPRNDMRSYYHWTWVEMRWLQYGPPATTGAW